MRVGLSWLRDYVDFEVGGVELARRLSESLTETECLGAPGAGLTGLTAARVVTCESHPDARDLSVCVVDWGKGSSTVVCGAPNARAGMTSVLALPGAKLAGGLTVGERTIRGRRSHGMLVSAAELGLEDASDGIIELAGDISPGDDVREALALDEEVIELDVQPNRPDCLGVIGMAREIAAVLGTDLRLPGVVTPEDGDDVHGLARVTLEDPDGCPRYIARVVRDLEFGPSPAWLVNRLRGAGLRSIGNIVDVTNFVMLEYGHPIHAFDYDTLSDGHIVVRRAREGERLTTLDGVEHELDTAHLLICDGGRPVALAGIMGGGETEVREATRNILLECAWFDPVVIRRGARSLGMRTEASQRFERGIDRVVMPDVAARACALLAEVAGGRVASGSIDEGTSDIPERRVSLRPESLRAMLMDGISDETISEHLEALGFDVRTAPDGTSMDVGVPSHRRDVEAEADLIEEVARIHGYDEIEPVVPFHSLAISSDREAAGRSAVREAMVGLGLVEVLTSSFMTRTAVRVVGGDAVELANPVNKEVPLLRTSMIPGLLDVLVRNRNIGERDVRIFEIGKVFEKASGGEGERWHLAGALTGDSSRRSWDREPEKVDYYDGKGILWGLMEALDIDSQKGACYDIPFLSKGAGARLSVGGREVGIFGMLSREAVEAWDLEGQVFAFELDLGALLESGATAGRFKTLPRYPKVRRDVALVVAEETEAGDVLAAIGGLGEKLLVDVEVFDVYRGTQLAPGSKSIAFSLTYMSNERTLTDGEVDEAHGRVVDHLLEAFRATLRQ